MAITEEDTPYQQALRKHGVAPGAAVGMVSVGGVEFGVPDQWATLSIRWGTRPGRRAGRMPMEGTDGSPGSGGYAARPSEPVQMSALDSLRWLYGGPGPDGERITPEELADLQAALYLGGFYSDSYYSESGRRRTFTPGLADDDTLAAWRNALERTARHDGDLSVFDVITEAMAAREAAGDNAGPAEKPPPPLVLLSDEDVAALVQQIAKDALGQGDVDPATIDRAKRAVHERQRTAYQSGISGDPEFEGEPGAAGLGEVVRDVIEEQHPGETQAYGVAQAFEDIAGLFTDTHRRGF